MEALTALRPRLALSILAVAGVAMFLALSPADARAECVSSTPSTLGANADTPLDNFGGAADIRELHVALDANCELLVYPVLLPLPLLDNQLLIVQFDRDGDEIVDVEVYVYPGNYVELDDGTPLPGFDPTQFSVTVDELGIMSPTQLGIAVTSVFADPNPPNALTFGDDHPELVQPMLRFPVSFTQPTPPPPPPPPPPAPPAPPAPLAVMKKAGCVVPKLKGLTVKKAKAALKKAGCKYKLKGKGRVRSFSPKAGTTTEATVQVKCKKRKRKKRSRRSALRVAHYR
jgi:hypothetical protein